MISSSTVGRLPDGRDHAVVYADLLHVVPAQLRWHSRASPCRARWSRSWPSPRSRSTCGSCARALEADLVHSPFGSDTALIGQVAHVFQELAEEHAGLDGTVVSRADRGALGAPAPGEGPDLASRRRAPLRAAGGTAVNPTRAVRALVGAALDPDGPATVHDLVRIFAQVTDCLRRGALGGARRAMRPGRAVRSCRCGSTCRRPTLAFEAEVDADAVTALAFDTRSLAVPDDVPDRSAALVGLDVMGALPIDYVDGCRGVLTLLGRSRSPPVFDTVVELVDVLPELCGTVRERQTLALVNACDTILHDADVESRERAVSRPQLAELLSEVCRFLAVGLHAAEVSIFLEDPAQPPGRYTPVRPLRWTRARACDPGHAPARGHRAHRPHRLRPTAGGAPFMEVRLLSGTHVNGLVRCLGTEGPPHHFTTSDLALLRPVAAPLSRYWRTWQHRRALSEENESWRRLAAGMTSLNKLVAEELDRVSRRRGQEHRVADLAVRICATSSPSPPPRWRTATMPAAGTTEIGRCRAHRQRDGGRSVRARRGDRPQRTPATPAVPDGADEARAG